MDALIFHCIPAGEEAPSLPEWNPSETLSTALVHSGRGAFTDTTVLRLPKPILSPIDGRPIQQIPVPPPAFRPAQGEGHLYRLLERIHASAQRGEVDEEALHLAFPQDQAFLAEGPKRVRLSPAPRNVLAAFAHLVHFLDVDAPSGSGVLRLLRGESVLRLHLRHLQTWNGVPLQARQLPSEEEGLAQFAALQGGEWEAADAWSPLPILFRAVAAFGLTLKAGAVPGRVDRWAQVPTSLPKDDTDGYVTVRCVPIAPSDGPLAVPNVQHGDLSDDWQRGRNGLFCDAIFGARHPYSCACGKARGLLKACEICGITTDITRKSRWEQWAKMELPEGVRSPVTGLPMRALPIPPPNLRLLGSDPLDLNRRLAAFLTPDGEAIRDADALVELFGLEARFGQDAVAYLDRPPHVRTLLEALAAFLHVSGVEVEPGTPVVDLLRGETRMRLHRSQFADRRGQRGSRRQKLALTEQEAALQLQLLRELGEDGPVAVYSLPFILARALRPFGVTMALEGEAATTAAAGAAASAETERTAKTIPQRPRPSAEFVYARCIPREATAPPFHLELVTNESLSADWSQGTRGLFCQQIFGPVHPQRCACGLYDATREPMDLGYTCSTCGVFVTSATKGRAFTWAQIGLPGEVRSPATGRPTRSVPVPPPYFRGPGHEVTNLNQRLTSLIVAASAGRVEETVLSDAFGTDVDFGENPIVFAYNPSTVTSLSEALKNYIHLTGIQVEPLSPVLSLLQGETLLRIPLKYFGSSHRDPMTRQECEGKLQALRQVGSIENGPRISLTQSLLTGLEAFGLTLEVHDPVPDRFRAKS